MISRVESRSDRKEDIRELVSELRALADRLERFGGGNLVGSPPGPGPGRPSDVEFIVRTVATHYALAPELLMCRRKFARLVWPRQVAMFFAREHTAWTLTDIGAFFGRDHGTVRNAVQRVCALRDTDSHRRAEIESLHAQLTRNEPTR